MNQKLMSQKLFYEVLQTAMRAEICGRGKRERKKGDKSQQCWKKMATLVAFSPEKTRN